MSVFRAKVPAEAGDKPPLDVEEIMNRIRAQVKASPRSASRPRYVPPAAKLFDADTSPVLYSEELQYLNAHWNDWSEIAEPFSSHRPVAGKLIAKLKTKFRNFLWGSIFRDYFQREREFQAQLVRFLNSTARYVDARDAALFWQLVKKIDNDIVSVNERADFLFDELRTALDETTAGSHDSLSREGGALKTGIARGAFDSGGTGAVPFGESHLAEFCKTTEGPLLFVRARRRGPQFELELSSGAPDSGAGNGERIVPDALEERLSALGAGTLSRLVGINLHGVLGEQHFAALIRTVRPGGTLLFQGDVLSVEDGQPGEPPLTENLKRILEERGVSVERSFNGPGDLFRPLPAVEYLPSAWQAALVVFNRNMERLNQVLAPSSTSYAIYGRVV